MIALYLQVKLQIPANKKHEIILITTNVLCSPIQHFVRQSASNHSFPLFSNPGIGEHKSTLKTFVVTPGYTKVIEKIPIFAAEAKRCICSCFDCVFFNSNVIKYADKIEIEITNGIVI